MTTPTFITPGQLHAWNVAAGSGGPYTFTVTTNPGTANLFLVSANGRPPTSISDSRGNQYTERAVYTHATNGQLCFRVWSAVGISQNTVLTIGFAATPGAGNGVSVVLHALTDVVPAQSFVNNGNSAAPQTPTGPLTYPSQLAIGFQANGNETPVWQAPWTQFANTPAGNGAGYLSSAWAVASQAGITGSTTHPASRAFTQAVTTFGPKPPPPPAPLRAWDGSRWRDTSSTARVWDGTSWRVPAG